jgi:hypothetical protein
VANTEHWPPNLKTISENFMDITQIVQGVLNLLIPALPKITEGAFTKIGEKLGESPFQLYEMLRKRFRKGTKVSQAFDKLASNPNSIDFQEHFRQALTSLLRRDPIFTEELKKFIFNATVQQGAVSIAGNQNVVRQSIDRVANNFFEIKPGYAETIQFILNFQDVSVGSTGKTLKRPIAESKNNQQSIAAQVRNLLPDDSPDLQLDLDLIIEVLQPIARIFGGVVVTPGRFLGGITAQMGAKLDEAGIFESNLASDKRDLSQVTLTREIEFKEIARTFSKDPTTVQFVQVKSSPRPLPIIGAFFPPKKKVLGYRIEYYWYPIIALDEYHLEFSKRKHYENIDAIVRMQARLGRDIPYPSKEPDEHILLSKEIMHKFLKALFHDYLLVMRYQAHTRIYLSPSK